MYRFDAVIQFVVSKPSIRLKAKAERGGDHRNRRIGRHVPTPDLDPRGDFETISIPSGIEHTLPFIMGDRLFIVDMVLCA